MLMSPLASIKKLEYHKFTVPDSAFAKSVKCTYFRLHVLLPICFSLHI